MNRETLKEMKKSVEICNAKMKQIEETDLCLTALNNFKIYDGPFTINTQEIKSTAVITLTINKNLLGALIEIAEKRKQELEKELAGL